MKLREYLIDKFEKPYQFAKRAGVRPATIYSLCKNSQGLNLTNRTMAKIVKATGGRVRLEDLV